jgi:antitoxin component YwqK of YwqJK toxin-antitoxin module
MRLVSQLIVSLVCIHLLIAQAPSLQAQTVLEARHYENGQVKALWFDMGAERIQLLRFHPNGKLAEIGNWESGRRHGVWANWAENGTKLGEAEYRFGRRFGTWRLWDAAGNHCYDLEYRSDALIAYTEITP